MNKMILALIVLLFSQAAHCASFSSSKKILRDMYSAHPYTFYYRAPIVNGKPDINAVGYTTAKYVKRSKRIEWEHIMPAYDFGRNMQCWQNGGRKACGKDPRFKIAESDMHNLVPAIGSVNAMRSNKKFVGKRRSRHMIIGDTVVPPQHVIGDIARAYLYMSKTYRINLSKGQRKQMEAWSRMDPVDAWECRKNRMVESIQGNDNPFISSQCN